MAKPELEILAFKLERDFESWLDQNHACCPGIWLKFFKNASGKPTVTYAQALDVALCYGWIDGQVKRFDEAAYLQRFTPRRARSMWSQRNCEHVARLAKAGRIKPAGQKQIDAAKGDGRWGNAYPSPKNVTVPADFMAALAKNKKALASFEKLNKANRNAIGYQLMSAKKPETRERRMKKFLQMLAKRQKLH